MIFMKTNQKIKIFLNKNLQRSCGDVACDMMDQRSNCVQFYVKEETEPAGVTQPTGSVNQSFSEPSSFVLHLDEVDVIGICQRRRFYRTYPP
mgnify:CR=1 FL=1